MRPEQSRLLELRQRRQAAAAISIPRRAHNEAVPLTAAQAALWYFCRHEGGSAAYMVPRVFEIEGPLDVERLRVALARVVERHETLRTIFVERSGEPFQLVLPVAPFALPVTELQGGDAEGWLRQEATRGIDISTGPLLQAELARSGEQRHVLLLRWHHIVSDQRSGRILDEELSALYRGQEPAELPIQFPDYSEWEHHRLRSRDVETARSFWKEQLQGLPPLLDLAYGRARPPERDYKGAVERFDLDPALTAQIRSFGASRKLTLFPIFLAAFAVLLSRYSGRTDIPVGVPVSGRDLPELEGLIGYFVNLLPLRLDVRGQISFEELARDCHELFAKCSALALPFDTIVDVIRPERNRSYSPIFQYVLGYIREGEETLQLDGLSARRISYHNDASPFDISITVLDRQPHIRLLVEYNPALFGAGTIRRMSRHFLRVLELAAVEETVNADAIAILSDEERRTILVGRNATQETLDETETVLSAFERQAAQTPRQMAILAGDQEWSAGQLNAFADRVCAALQEQGIAPGDLVAVDAERSPETIAVMLGVWKAGAVWLPLDPRWPVERAQFAVVDSGAKIEIDAEWLSRHLPGKADSLAGRSTPDSIAYVLYTSGSTGQPKGVPIRHESLFNCLCSIQREPGFGADDTLLSVTPLSFDISLGEILLPLISGARLILPDLSTAANPRAVRRLLEENDVTVMLATPIMWRSLIEEGWRGGLQLRAWCTGEAMPPSVAEGLLDRASAVWNLYGPTETAIWSALHCVIRGESPVPVGRPIANTQCYVLDANLQPVPDGVPGQLFLAGTGLSPGYIGHAEENNRERFPANPFITGARMYRTGDVAMWSVADEPCAANLIFLHRDDTQVKVRGLRIELGEVEAALLQLPDVRQTAVAVHREALAAWVVPTDAAEWNPQRWRAELRTKLPEYMIPGIFVPVDQLPLNSSGKVDRKKLPAPENINSASPDDARPADHVTATIENTLREIWEELLEVQPIGRHDNFFELGGHSLLVAKLYDLIDRVFSKRVPDSALIEAPTVAGLAAILQAQGGTFSPLVVLQPSGDRPAFFCVHAGAGRVINLRELADALGPDQPVYGLQAVGLDGTRPHHTRIEEMAACYIAEIRAVQPHGPYYLGGYCFGGLVALEMAQQLTAAGEQIGILAVLSGGLRSRRLVRSLHWRAQVLLRSLNEASPGRKILLLARRVVSGLFRRFLSATKRPVATAATPVSAGLFSVNAAHRMAERNYQPRSYPHVVTLFRTSLDEVATTDPTFGWGAVARNGLVIEQVPGTHVSSVQRPHVTVLAARLRHHLQAAQEGAPAGPHSRSNFQEERS